MVRYEPTNGFTTGPAPGRPAARRAERGQQIRRQRPHGGGQQRDIDDRAPTRSGSVEQRARDPEGQRHGTVAVPHGAPLADRVVTVGRRQDVGQPTPGPEGRRVVPGRSASGPLTPKPCPRA